MLSGDAPTLLGGQQQLYSEALVANVTTALGCGAGRLKPAWPGAVARRPASPDDEPGPGCT